MYRMYKESIYCSNDFVECNLFFLSKLIDSCFMGVINFDTIRNFTMLH